MKLHRNISVMIAAGAMLLLSMNARAEDESPPADEEAPTSSLLAQSIAEAQPQDEDGERHALRDSSMFAIPPVEPRAFKKHDLVQIIVRESSKAESTQEIETKKDYKLDGKISAWPDLSLSDLVNLQAFAGRTAGLPQVKVDFKKDFKGEGDYKREDDFSARLTAEVIEVLPNGNLVLESRTFIKTDEEESTIKVTGICRPTDVTAANTVLSSQIHDLKIIKMHKGQLKKSSEKGIIAKFLDTIFAF